jgi:hypothetical protein
VGPYNRRFFLIYPAKIFGDDLSLKSNQITPERKQNLQEIRREKAAEMKRSYSHI